MAKHQASLTYRFVHWLRVRPKLVRGLLVPVGVFVLDLVLRTLGSLDFIDAGADLSLLALSYVLFPLTVGAEASLSDTKGVRKRVDATCLLFLVFLTALWAASLCCISDTTMYISALPKTARVPMSFAIGFGALVVATMFLPALADSEADMRYQGD